MSEHSGGVNSECLYYKQKVLAGKGKWQKVKIPFYEGPEGRWNAYYRTTINLSEKKAGKTYHIDFEAVDYIAEVYLNGKHIGTRIFAPYSFDMSDNVKSGENTIEIIVSNTCVQEQRDIYSRYMLIKPSGLIGQVKIGK